MWARVDSTNTVVEISETHPAPGPGWHSVRLGSQVAVGWVRHKGEHFPQVPPRVIHDTHAELLALREELDALRAQLAASRP